MQKQKCSLKLYTNFLIANHNRYSGLELSKVSLVEDMCHDAVSRWLATSNFTPEMTVILGTGENLPFNDLTFDFVFVIVTLCFVENPVSAMKEAGRVLKRGGRLIVG